MNFYIIHTLPALLVLMLWSWRSLLLIGLPVGCLLLYFWFDQIIKRSAPGFLEGHFDWLGILAVKVFTANWVCLILARTAGLRLEDKGHTRMHVLWTDCVGLFGAIATVYFWI